MRIQEQRRWSGQQIVIALIVVVLAGLVIWGLLTPAAAGRLSAANPGQSAIGTVLALALPTFLAGVFSFLSPCTLPILPAYFAFSFQARRQQVALMTLAFFLGLATMYTLLGAALSLLGRAIYDARETLMFWGGLVVIGLGVANMLGKGLGSVKMQARPSATFAGTYLFGMTFALGWTACTGPILGALSTLLVAQGASVLAGGALALIYTLGLALPLFLVAVFFRQLGSGSRAWKVLAGRGFTVNIFGRTLYLHTTSLLSGLLLVLIGYLLASGELFRLSVFATSTRAGQWALAIETAISRLFNVQ
jgi:cytochrome c-type biogenesis protein